MSNPASDAFELDRYLEQIRAFEGDRFRVEVAGVVPDGERECAILAVSSRQPASKTLLVLAGVHGDEVAGLLAVPAILAAWSSERVRLVVVTPVNPVGAARQTRGNGGGRDVNRDFVRFATPEASAVRAVFERVRPDFVLSLHEGPQRGTFLFTNRHVTRALGVELCDALSRGGSVLSKKDYFGRRLDPPGLAPATIALRALWTLGARLFRHQASIAYSQDRGIPEIVLESSRHEPDPAARVRPHVDLASAVARSLARAEREEPKTK